MKRTQKDQVDFKMLESITTRQNNIRNYLLLFCAEKAMNKAQDENKTKRKEQFDDLQKSMDDLQQPTSSIKRKEILKHITKQWWDDEIKWWKKHSNKYKRTAVLNGLSYRLLSMFFLNHIHCPFYTETRKGRKPDSKDFNKENQKQFKRFLNQSIKLISSQKEFQPIIDILFFLKKSKKINIFESIGSATHKLYGKDWSIAKGLLVGGITGVVASIFLGPVIGGYIGNLAGLSGAAATSYGLALLGGGSLVAGGLGMAGGSAVLGLGFGISNGIRCGIKNMSKDELNTMQAQALLPVFLAIGRALFENENKIIPELIHRTISKRLEEFEQRLKNLENEYDKIFDSDDEKEIESLKKSIKLVERSITLYERAKDMSLHYDWTSGYDIWKDIQSWAS